MYSSILQRQAHQHMTNGTKESLNNYSFKRSEIKKEVRNQEVSACFSSVLYTGTGVANEFTITNEQKL